MESDRVPTPETTFNKSLLLECTYHNIFTFFYPKVGYGPVWSTGFCQNLNPRIAGNLGELFISMLCNLGLKKVKKERRVVVKFSEANSVTRCLKYFSIFGHFHRWKLAQWHTKYTAQICQSGENSPNLVTLEAKQIDKELFLLLIFRRWGKFY